MKLSIIIPVYNTAPFIADCIGSCLHQTGVTLGKDYEIICVNDGSTDNSLVELERLNPLETRNLRYGHKNGGGGYLAINQANNGVSSARNNGLSQAHGDYVWFVDFDDFIAENSLKPLIDFVETQKNDGVIFDVNFVNESASPSESVQTGSLHQGAAKGAINVVWRYCIRRNFLFKNNIWFDPAVSYCEDQLWQFWISLFKPTFSIVTDRLYNYRNRSTSAMHTRNPLSRQKHLESMLGMLRSYQQAETNLWINLNNAERKHLHYNIHKSVQNIMFDLLRQSPNTRNKTIETLKKEKLYPYPILWNTILKYHSLRNLRINAFCLLFPIPLYYKILAKLNDRYHLF